MVAVRISFWVYILFIFYILYLPLKTQLIIGKGYFFPFSLKYSAVHITPVVYSNCEETVNHLRNNIQKLLKRKVQNNKPSLRIQRTAIGRLHLDCCNSLKTYVLVHVFPPLS